MATDVVSRVTTIIAAVDKTTAVVKTIQQRFLALGNVARGVTDRFRALTDRTGLTRLPGVFSSITTRAREAARSFADMALPLIGLGAGGATVAGLFDLGHALDTFVETGARLNVVSTRVGTTVVQLQNLEHAAAPVNLPAEVMDTNLQRLNRTLAQVAVGKNKEATKLLGFVGISARDATGHVKSAATVLPQLADVFTKIHNPAQRARLAVGLFGKGGQALIPVLIGGARGLRDAARDMAKLGYLTGHEAEEAHALENAQRNLRLAFDRIQQVIGAALAPSAQKAADAVTTWVIANRRLIETRIHEWVTRGATAIRTFWRQLQTVDWASWLTGLETTGRVFRALLAPLARSRLLLGGFVALLVAPTVLEYANAVRVLGRALVWLGTSAYAAAGPWGLLAAALVVAGVAVYAHWTKIAHSVRYYGKVIEKDSVYYFHRFETVVARTMGAVRKTVDRDLDAIVNAFKTAWNGIATNPLVAALGPLFGVGFGGFPTLALPAPAAAGPGPLRVPPPQPGPYRSGYVFPHGRAVTGNVDVHVRVDAVPGTRVATKARGEGLRASQSVGYSFPQLRS